MAAPALVFRQLSAARPEEGMAVGVLRARRQRGGVPSWLIEQGQIDIARIADTLRRSPPQRCHQSASARALSAVSRSLLFATMMSAAAS